ncbi:molybdopterin-dependent oxidoreductase [Planctomicrobium sp. SH664]|uniref:molybdopterin-dependent oxidoreductase n=1 Tax=Planctomicrobium sp. SH664 TaxID=3448125 RepID=UPI003F5C2B55
MPTAYINNQPIELDPNERLNCIQAAQKIGFEIPAYCYHPELTVVASCRMCLVEVGDMKPDGTVAMQPKLVPGCQTPVKEGTVVVADSPKVRAAQKATLEYLLLNHPLDCPTCDQAGECYLQDYSFRYGRGYSRLQEPKNQKPDKDYIGDQITLFTDRCIMCSRCVRFTREVSGSAELQIINRGTHAEIDIFPGHPVNNKLAGNVVDLCPVGALCSKDFLYKQRVWWLKSSDSVCPNCSTGCSIHVDQNEDHVYRLRPRVNPQAQGSFMCDEGRFGFKYIQDENRLRSPEWRDADRVITGDWEAAFGSIRKLISEVSKRAPHRLAAVISPWATVEEAWLLCEYFTRIAPGCQLAVGPVRVEGEDDKYPKNVHGEPIEPTRFTIRAEKCPNRRGVELVIQHFTKKPATFADILTQAAGDQLSLIYCLGGDPGNWITEAQAASLGKAKLVVQDLLPSPATAVATWVLPGGAFAEKDGTFVNYKGLAQHIHRAVRGPGDSRPDGRILWELTERTGLYRAASLRKEIAEAIPSLAVLNETKAETGVFVELQTAVGAGSTKG